MSSPQYLELEQMLLRSPTSGFGLGGPVTPKVDEAASYTGQVEIVGAGVPDGALRCGLCHKAWGGNVACGDCGAMVYGPQPVEAGPSPADDPRPASQPSAAAQAAVEAAVAAAVRPQHQIAQRHPEAYGAIHGRAQSRPTQDRMPRLGPAVDSPLLASAAQMVMPPQAALPMMWPAQTVDAAQASPASYGVPSVGFVSQPVMQPMVPAMAQPIAQPVAQPMVQPMAQPAAQPMVQAVAQPVAQPMVQPMMQPVAQPMVQQMVQPVAQPVVYSYASPVNTGPMPALQPLKPSYRGMAQLSTRPVEASKVQQPWVVEALLAAVGSGMVAIAVVVWWRIHSRIQQCTGGACPDLDAVVSDIQYNGWSVIALSALAMLMAGFSLRKTRGTDLIRALGALALIGGMVTMVLGALLLNTSLS
ncbi:MAG: hypothetical protein LBK95_07165 [Bifidobacteriaceae bacterium]|jgi:hypothetical protein|nr:hypothetical protein [Bifidobacteriaceae bacterium]